MYSVKARWLAALALSFSFLGPVVAHAALSVTPLTWNVIGLDSNSPASGPQYFPVGARVCSSTNTTNVGVSLAWDSANAYVNLRTGSQGTVTIPSIAANACADAYFEVQVTQVAAAYDTVRRYHITATDGTGSASTPTPRELYVEHLISQNRNAVTGVKLDGVAIAPGGAMNLVVGNTYAIELDGGTATQGYNQFEAFINFPNTIFQILSVSTTYSADNSPYVPNPSNKLYADACLWQNDPASPNYRSCIGGDYKAGGSDVRTTYTVKIISGGGTSQPLYALLYDFSGSSYHYNGDFAGSARIANIVDPASLGFAKAFAPAATVAGGTSTLTFTITNTTGAAIAGANFADTLPTLSGSPMTVASPASYSTSGCGSPTFAPVAGATSIAFANGTVAANSTCVVSVQVKVPAAPNSGTYVNTSGNLFIGSLDTGKSATANLGIAATSGGTGICNLTMAQWDFGAYTANPAAPSTQAANVGTAAVTSGNGLTLVPDTTASGGNPQPGMRMYGWLNNTAINTATSPYVQFAIDTSNYTQVTLRFDAQRKANGPANDALYYSIDGVNWTQKATFASTTTWTTYGAPYDFTGQTSTTGITYFRIYGNGANTVNSGADLTVDNVTFGGCGAAAMPTLTKSFTPNPIAVGGTSTLTFTIANSNTAALTGATFTDGLPAGLQVAGSPSASTTCAGSPTWSPTPGATTVTFGQPTGAIVPAKSGAVDGACTASVNVTAATAGPHTNVSGFVASTESGTNSGPGGSAVASLTALSPPSIAKSFAPTAIPAGGAALLTFTIANPNASDALSGVAFSDTYPAGLVNVNPLTPAVTNSCGGTVTANAGAGGLSLSGGTLSAGGSCTITVTVTAAAAGSYANATGTVSANVAGNGNTAGATLQVNAPQPAIGLLKNVGTSSNGPWFKYLTVTPGTNLYYQFIVENTGNVALDPYSVSDPTLAGTAADPANCVWPTTTLPVATATNDPTATCVVGPIASIIGDHPNTATAHGTYGGIAHDSSPSVADYIGATPGFSLLKQVGPSAAGPWSSSIIVASGGSVFYRFTLINTGAFALDTVYVTDPLVSTASCTFTSPLPVGGATMCVVGPVTATGAAGSTTPNTATGHGTVGAASYDTATSTASFTIDGASADLAIAKSNGVSSVNAGGTTTYTITVTNNGPSGVTGAILADPAVAGLTKTAVACSGTPGQCATAPTIAQLEGGAFALPALASGATYQITVTADVTATSGSVANTATIAAPAGTTDPNTGNNTATDTDTVTPVADLAITKGNGATSVNAGGTTTYTITVTNNGPSGVTGAILADPAVAGLTKTAVACSGTPGQCATAPTIAQLEGGAFALPALASGATYQITVTADVTAAGGSVANTATVATPPGTSDPNAGNNSATDTDTVTAAAPTADLAITKSDGATSVNAGGTTTYTITVTNNGPSGVTGAILADPAVAGLTKTAVACSGTPGQCATAPTIAQLEGGAFALPALASGATYQITVTADVTATSGSVANTATIAAPAGTTDPNTGNNTATDTDTVTPVADLAITKGNGATSVNAGGTTTYTITVTNNGPSGVTGAILADPAVAGLTKTAVACSGTPGQCATAPTIAQLEGGAFALPALASGATYQITVTADVTAAGGSVANTATVATPPGTSDPNAGNNSATDTDTVTAAAPTADLAITKSDGATSVNAGGTTTYTITVTNNGPSGVTGAILADPAVAGLTKTAVACSGTPGQCVTAPTIAQLEGGAFALPALASGATYQITVTADVTATSGSVANTATIAAPAGTTDPNTGNNTATDTDTVTPVADLAITKSNGVSSVNAGGTTTYTITVTNNGPSEVTGAAVVDTAPAGLTFGNWTCAVTSSGSGVAVITACGAASGSGNLNTTVTMRPGAVITYTVPASIAANATGSVANTATVSAPAGTTDPNTGNNSATDTDTVTQSANLVVAKTDNSQTYVPGGTGTYVVTVTNTGASNAVAVTVSDTLPAGVTLAATVSCVAAGTANCGTVTGSAGQSSFGATGASVAAGAGNSLTFTVPVAYASAMTTDPLVNTATATDPASPNASGSDSSTRAAAAALVVAKTDGSASYAPGGTATYVVTVTNAGPSDALDVTVADTLPPGVLLTAAVTCTATGAASCGTVTGAIGQGSFGATGARVGAAAADSLVFNVPVAFAAGLATDPLVNSATATDVATGATATGSDSNTRAAQVTLAVVKTDNSATYTPGGTATYTVTVTNTGLSLATSVAVTDALPAGVTLAGNVSCMASGASTCGTVVGSAGQTSFGATGAQIAPGAANHITFTIPVNFAAALATDPLVNSATATDAPSGATGTGVDSDARAPSVTLVVAKTDNSATYTPGGTATYTITVTNTGTSDALNVTVNDALPAGVTLNATASCAATGIATCGTVTGTAGQASFGATGAGIGAGAGNALVFTVPVAFAPGLADNPLTNTATATDLASGASASGSDIDALAANVTLAVVKTDGSATYTPGATATYTVTVRNTGTSNATDVTITDPLPPGVTLAGNASCSASGSASCGSVQGTTGQSSFGTAGARIDAGVGNTLVLQAPVAFAANLTANPLVNTVTVTDVASGASGSASDSDTLATSGASLTKSIVPGTIAPGGTATLTLVLGNANAVPLTLTAAFTDPMPAGVTTTSGNTGTCSGVTVGSTLVAMAAGATIPPGGCTIVVTITSTTPGTVTNVTGSLQTDAGTTPPASAPITVTPPGGPVPPTVAKAIAPAAIAPGGSATLTITLGNGNATPLTLSAAFVDTMPAGVTTTSGNTGTCTGVTVTPTQVTMAAGATIPPGGCTIVVAITSTTPGTVTNTTGGLQTDGGTAPPASAPITVTPPGGPTADLAITKTNNVSSVTPGSVVTYTIVVTNNGPSAVVGATVTDTVPAALTGVTWTCAASAGSSCPASGSGSINASVSLLAGGTATFTLTGTLSASATGTLTNTATVAPPPGTVDPVSGNDSATDSDPIVVPVVDLAIAKQNVGTFFPGQVGAQYVITVTNVGTVPSSGLVTVTDVLPAGLTATAIGGTGWTCTQPAGPCTRSDPLAPGASYPAITLTVNVDPNPPATLVNTVNLAGGGDVNGANNNAKNVVSFAPVGPGPEPIPAGSPATLALLALLLAVLGGRQVAARRRD